MTKGEWNRIKAGDYILFTKSNKPRAVYEVKKVYWDGRSELNTVEVKSSDPLADRLLYKDYRPYCTRTTRIAMLLYGDVDV